MSDSIIPTPERFERRKDRVRQLVIIGHTTTTSAKLWVKTPTEGVWVLALSTEPFRGDLDIMGGEPVEQWLRTRPELTDPKFYSWDMKKSEGLCHCFSVDGLQENTRYYYILTAEQGAPITEDGRTVVGDIDDEFFTTAAASPESLKFAAFSCHDPFSWGFPNDGAWPKLYRTVLREGLDLALACGDQVYLDTNDKRMTDLWKWLTRYKNELRYKREEEERTDDEIKDYLIGLIRQYYRIYWNFESFGEVVGRIPTYMIWDDHEIMDGWGSRTREERRKLLNRLWQFDDEAFNEKIIELAWRAAARVYYEYQHSHNPDTGINDRNIGALDPCAATWDYAFERAGYHFYVLDVRAHHDCERSSHRLLGEEQHQRLGNWLASLSGAKAAFIISPVPVVHWSGLVDIADFSLTGMKDDLMDEWSHKTNHEERKLFLDAVMQSSNDHNLPIAIISGDVHCASAYRLTNAEEFPNAKVSQVTSSPISRKPNPAVAGSLVAKSGYMVTIDINGEEKKGPVYQERLFSKSGVNNYVVFDVRQDDGQTRMTADFYWPGDDEGEIIRQTLDL
uniref:Alkaline phosphatase D n=1 Tax=Candidatus Kentrum sp. MB TaxID=2138164 RepID=A0A451BFH7_9GAMM|nr:MAG: alkaline phosphatase D [Candidatus Kentron sp. MB]VFK34919.1 MAG: alkaline phosphatase D [Candidatus Kentron sp. MB]VFK77038.1 MAG: alkaline phosphatase D [Candidatus Kentron sp. MB]